MELVLENNFHAEPAYNTDYKYTVTPHVFIDVIRPGLVLIPRNRAWLKQKSAHWKVLLLYLLLAMKTFS
jgi:hypothetical protein